MAYTTSRNNIAERYERRIRSLAVHQMNAVDEARGILEDGVRECLIEELYERTTWAGRTYTMYDSVESARFGKTVVEVGFNLSECSYAQLRLDMKGAAKGPPDGSVQAKNGVGGSYLLDIDIGTYLFKHTNKKLNDLNRRMQKAVLEGQASMEGALEKEELKPKEDFSAEHAASMARLKARPAATKASVQEQRSGLRDLMARLHMQARAVTEEAAFQKEELAGTKSADMAAKLHREAMALRGAAGELNERIQTPSTARAIAKAKSVTRKTSRAVERATAPTPKKRGRPYKNPTRDYLWNEPL